MSEGVVGRSAELAAIDAFLAAAEKVAGRAGIPFERVLESVRAPGPTRRGDS